MNLFVTFLIGFCIGGLVSCDKILLRLYNLKDQENISKFER